MPVTEIAAHRGGAFLWPENSLLAFRQALALPLEQVELDVHLSRDGAVVVVHDPTLDRMTDGAGAVREQDWQDIRRLRVRGAGGEAVPDLAQVAALVQPTGKLLRLEIKSDAAGRPYPGMLEACLAVLDQLALRPRTVLMSFEPATVAMASQAGGFAQVVQLIDTGLWNGLGLPAAIALCQAGRATEVGLHMRALDAAVVAGFRSAGLRVGAWGANHAASIRRALELGLDVMATDDPPLALSLRG